MKFILIGKDNVMAEYDDYTLAYWAGVELYGHGNFIIKINE